MDQQKLQGQKAGFGQVQKKKKTRPSGVPAFVSPGQPTIALSRSSRTSARVGFMCPVAGKFIKTTCGLEAIAPRSHGALRFATRGRGRGGKGGVRCARRLSHGQWFCPLSTWQDLMSCICFPGGLAASEFPAQAFNLWCVLPMCLL